MSWEGRWYLTKIHTSKSKSMHRWKFKNSHPEVWYAKLKKGRHQLLVRCKKSKAPKKKNPPMPANVCTKFVNLDRIRYIRLKIKYVGRRGGSFFFIREQAGSKYADTLGLVKTRYEIRYQEIPYLLLRDRFYRYFKQQRPSSSCQTFLQTLLLLP